MTHEVGRIPQCLQRWHFDQDDIDELLNLLKPDGFGFNPNVVSKYGWQYIKSENDGQILDEEEALILSFMRQEKIHTMYVASPVELKKAENGYVLSVRLNEPSFNDLCCLRGGWWIWPPYRQPLLERGVLWDDPDWRHQMWFTLPLKFAMVRFLEGYGETHFIGMPNLIESFMKLPSSQEFPNAPPWNSVVV